MRSLAVLVFSLVCFGQSTEEAFRKYWSAPSPSAAAKAASDIVKSGVSFEEAWRRLKAGRTYAPAKKDNNFSINLERAEYWISKGAQPSDTVASFIRKSRRAVAATK